MRSFLVLTLLLLLPLTSARAEGPPSLEACNQADKQNQLQLDVIKDLRARVRKDQEGANAYSFKFTDIWHLEDGTLTKGLSDLSVYFEIVSGDGNRQPFAAQYRVAPDTCALDFKKMQLLVGGLESSPDILASGDKDICNYGDGQDKIHNAVATEARWMAADVMQEWTPGNFAFTAVKRVDGASEAIATWELRRAGFLPTLMLGQVKVEPDTCKTSLAELTPVAKAPNQY